MSAQVLTNVQLLMGGFDLSQFSGSFDESIETEMKEANHFAALGYRIVIPGVTKAMASVGGHADYASGAVSSTFNSSSKGSQFAFSINPNGTNAAAGDSAVLMRGVLSSMKMLTGSTGDVADFSMGLESDAAAVHGYVAAPLASRTTSGLTGGAVLAGAVSASQRLYAALHVTAAAGTNLVVTIQSDDNSGFTAPTTQITFATMSATGWQFLSVAGPITDTYYRVVATIATSTFSFAVTLGVA